MPDRLGQASLRPLSFTPIVILSAAVLTLSSCTFEKPVPLSEAGRARFREEPRVQVIYYSTNLEAYVNESSNRTYWERDETQRIRNIAHFKSDPTQMFRDAFLDATQEEIKRHQVLFSSTPQQSDTLETLSRDLDPEIPVLEFRTIKLRWGFGSRDFVQWLTYQVRGRLLRLSENSIEWVGVCERRTKPWKWDGRLRPHYDDVPNEKEWARFEEETQKVIRECSGELLESFWGIEAGWKWKYGWNPSSSTESSNRK